MERRKFIHGAGIAGVLAAGAAPAVHAQATIRWRLTSAFPKALDTIFGAAEVFPGGVTDRANAAGHTEHEAGFLTRFTHRRHGEGIGLGL